MFSLFEGVYDSYLAPTQLNVLVIGAPGVGKTTLLERLKVTQFPKRPSSQPLPLSSEDLTPALRKAFEEGGVSYEIPVEENPQSPEKPKVKAPASTPKIVVTQKRRFLPHICPAPERYRKSTQDQEEDFIEDDGNVVVTKEEKAEINSDLTEEMKPFTVPLEASLSPGSPEAPRRVRCHSKEISTEDLDVMHNDENQSSMEDIPINSERDESQQPQEQQQPQGKSLEQPEQNCYPSLLQSKFEELNIKPNTKMLPMDRIRPTIGTNLAKLDIFGAKCHFFDVGGRMKNVWDKYYDDCDAVIFCWKLGEDPDKPSVEDNSENEEEPFDISKQQEILTEVRKSIPDDIPFLIFGHVFGNANKEITAKMLSTDSVLPHYHNPMTTLSCGSAKTGAGVLWAMEWLVPLSKRQQKERSTARKQVKDIA